MDFFPTLYKRTTKGQVQTWKIEVDGNRFFTHEGILDGKITTSKPTVCKGKNIGKTNETTTEEQAFKQAKAKHQKKLESDYHLRIEDIDKPRFYKPMLAKKYDDRLSKIDFPMISNPKLDGIRCVAMESGLFSRTGKPIVSVPHIFEALWPLFQQNPSLVLDGELYCDKFANDFNAICSLVRKTKPTEADLEESAGTIQYWVYDIPSSERTNVIRLDELEDLEDELDSSCIRFVEQTIVQNQAELDKLYETYIKDGYEGQIIRLCEGKYEQKRSNNLLKRKQFLDAEYEIVEVVEGEGNRSGTAGAMMLKREDGVTFKSNIKGTHSYTAELLSNKAALVGKMATCKFFELTPDGIPRFPYVIAIRDYE